MSQFIVSARKYRPSKFSDVIGQEHVSGTLKNALQTGHLAHAFLFTGPRGVGKTTCARILAKVINCETPTADFEACDTCGSCKAFNENASFNIHELDAASNNGIEHMRSLIDQVRFQPQQGKYKVFIIDEVHMLSTNAFNAFLKTLEEPPAHAIFILATTEKNKIIPTILSRCQIYDFKRIQIKDIVKQLKAICEDEKINAEEKALHIIAQKADGAMRDALSIFDRIVSFAGKKITYQDVISNLNVLDYDYFFRVTDCMMTEDGSGLLLMLEEILNLGFEPETFMMGIGEHIRNLLVCKDARTISLLELSEDFTKRYQETAHVFPNVDLLNALSIINHFEIHFKDIRNRRLHTELHLLRLANIRYLHKIGQNSLAEKEEKKTPDPKLNISQIADNQTISKVESKLSSEIIKESQASSIVKKSSTSYDTPSMISLQELEEEIRDEDSKHGEGVAFETENLTIAWNAYLEKTTSQSVRAVLNAALTRIEQNTIVVTVGTTLAKEIILQEKEIIQHIRNYFKKLDLMIEIEIDTSLAPELKPAKAKPLSAKEKYDKLVSENPAMDELRKRLHLRLDETL